MKTLLIAIVAMVAITANAKTEIVTDKLIDALIMVESSGQDKAVGDNGKAVGCLQIRKCVIDDVNRFYGTNYTLADRTDREKSKRICRLYLAMYATKANVGRKVTTEDVARIWNGGPKGYSKTATKKYWKKVVAFM